MTWIPWGWGITNAPPPRLGRERLLRFKNKQEHGEMRDSSSYLVNMLSKVA